MNPSDTQNSQTAQHHAEAQPPVNRPNEPHAGDHLSQYGMRSTKAVEGGMAPEPAPEEIDGLQAFDDEYTTRQARDQRPRSIPTGVNDPPEGEGSPPIPARE